jgi:Fic family protein
MGIKEQLKLIQQLSGLTQEQLARRLDVTFAAFNRWINGRATPHARTAAKITALLNEYTGQTGTPKNKVLAKKQAVLNKGRQHKSVIKIILNHPDIRDEFLLSLTYNSNRIEGNTLTKDDTAAVLFENAALPNKSLTEQLEAKNHQTALNYLFGYLAKNKQHNEAFILKLHSILMNGIRDDAGSYRNHSVRIVGANVPTANYLKVPKLMKELVKDINVKSKDVVGLVAAIHSRFEKIHPFSDGNGRIGRLLMHAMLLRDNLPPAVIKQQSRRLYMRYLNQAQQKEDLANLTDFVYDAVVEGYKILERK